MQSIAEDRLLGDLLASALPPNRPLEGGGDNEAPPEGGDEEEETPPG